MLSSEIQFAAVSSPKPTEQSIGEWPIICGLHSRYDVDSKPLVFRFSDCPLTFKLTYDGQVTPRHETPVLSTQDRVCAPWILAD
jgi:hypothetical protein